MVEAPKHLELISRIRERVDSGYLVVVIGWADKNHNPLTRDLMARGSVLFYSIPPERLSHRSGLVLTTRFVGHADRIRVRKQAPLCNNLFNPGQIKKLLKQAFVQEEPTPMEAITESFPDLPTTEPKEQVIMTEVIKEVPETTSSVVNGTSESRKAFASDFLGQIGADTSRSLSRYATYELLRKHFGPEAKAQHHRDLLEPVVKEGDQKAGSYRVTEVLIDLVTGVDVEPVNPAQKAEWLIAREPALLARRKNLEQQQELLSSQMREVDKQLLRVAKAKAALEVVSQI